MAWQGNFLVNASQTYGSATDVGRWVRDFWLYLVASGDWSAVQSADGLTVDTSGDIFTDDGFFGPASTSGPGGIPRPYHWGNTSSWIIVRHTSGLELCFWRSASTSWSYQINGMIKISGGGFTDNTSRSAIRPPDNADQIFLIGSGPTNTAGWAPNMNCLSHFGRDDAVIGTINSFCVTLTDGSQVERFILFLDAATDGPTGDPMPWMAYARSGTDCGEHDRIGASSTGPQSYRDFGGAGHLACRMPAIRLSLDSGSYGPFAFGTQPNGKVFGEAIRCGSGTNGVYKGFTSAIQWKGGAGRTYADRLDPASTDDLGPRVHFGDLLIPWPINTVPM